MLKHTDTPTHHCKRRVIPRKNERNHFHFVIGKFLVLATALYFVLLSLRPRSEPTVFAYCLLAKPRTNWKDPKVVSTALSRIWEHRGTPERASYGFSTRTDGTCPVNERITIDVWIVCVHNAPTTQLFQSPLSLPPRAAHVISASSVRGSCLLWTSAV